jgi:predicted RNA-binding Zn ribbon-like protein
VTPATLIELANLGRPRRPARATAPVTEPILPDPAIATRQLAPLAAGLVTKADLPSLRQVQQFAVQAAMTLLSGQTPECAELNALASASTARAELAVSGGRLQWRLVWDDASAGAGLARRLIEELAALDPSRLRRCARPACGLLFYDTTRSRTRRWHAENPCGWRERQHHRRTSHPATGRVALDRWPESLRRLRAQWSWAVRHGNDHISARRSAGASQ